MKLATLVWALVAASWAPPHPDFPALDGRPVLDGRAAVGYAYAHVFDPSPDKNDDGAAFVAQTMAAGGWSLPGASGADALARLLDHQEGVTLCEVIPGSGHPGGLNVSPGDILMVDWGVGDEKGSAAKNRATGHASEFMVVQGGLGGGDFVYLRKGPEGQARMGRFLILLNSPSFAQSGFRIYHVAGNEPTQGLIENGLYRDTNRLGVFLQVNGAFFWAHDDATVRVFGGWAKLNTLPKNTMFRQNEVPVSGTMIRELHDTAVWLVDGKVKCHVASDGGVRRLGGWDVVRTVPDGSIEDVLPKEGRVIP